MRSAARSAAATRLALRVSIAALTLLLSAASCDPGGALGPRVGVSVLPASIDVEPGASVAVSVRVTRDGVTGPVEIATLSAPSGVSMDAVIVPADATSVPATVRASATAALGDGTLRLEARAGAALASATVAVRVAPPVATVTGAEVIGTGGSRQVRQGGGGVTLRVSGTGLGQVVAATIGGVPATLGALGDGTLDLAVSVLHGAATGPRTLVLIDGFDRATSLADALVVTPIRADPSGDDVAGRGTDDAPYRTLTRALALAAAGDEVLLGAGTYAASDGEDWPTATGAQEIASLTFTNVPDGVAVRGVGRDQVVLQGPFPGDPDTGAVALAFADGGAVARLTLRGFSRGVAANEGSVRLDDVLVDEIASSGVAVSAAGRADVRVEGSSLVPSVSGSAGAIAYGGARLTLVDTTVMGGGGNDGGILVRQGAEVLVQRGSVQIAFPLVVIDEAVARVEDALLTSSGDDGYAVWALDASVVELHDATVTSGFAGVVFGGRVLVMRGTSVTGSPVVALAITGDPLRIDLGTDLAPGGNTLSGATQYQLSDVRDADRTTVITLSDTVLGAGVPPAELVNGPATRPGVLFIENEGNKVRFY